MRETAPGAVRMMANRLLDTNLRQGTDRAIGAHYSYLCPSPHEYQWQGFWDSCFQAIAIAHIDPEQAKSELRTLLAAQDDDGFIGHITFWGAKLRGLTHPSAYGQSRPGERLTHSALIQPPMLEPTRIWGPSVNWSRAAMASSAQRPMVPSAKAPLDWPWPR